MKITETFLYVSRTQKKNTRKYYENKRNSQEYTNISINNFFQGDCNTQQSVLGSRHIRDPDIVRK